MYLPEAAASALPRTADPVNPVDGILSPLLSRRPFYLAGAAAVLIAGMTMVLLPFGARPGPVLPPIVSMYAVMMCMVEVFTAYFLTIQFRSTGDVFLAALAGAFFFVAGLVGAQVLVFPGVFAAAGLFNGGAQSSIWMWAIWHTGFPLFILAALLARDLQRRPGVARHAIPIGRAFLLAGPGLAALASYVCVAHGKALPPLIAGGSYAALRHSLVMPVMMGATVLALAICVRGTRLNNLLSLWLAISLLASLADAVLSLSGGVRFDLGWYAGRILNVMSSSTVFCVLIFEISGLYDRAMKANGELTRRAVRDGLTGAFNRGFFAEQFPREVRRAFRENSMLSLLMIDADHFKTYNDLLGHQQGDECLIAIIAALQKMLKRPADFVARYGGEEFAIVLPYTTLQGATAFAEEVRGAIAELNLPRGDTAAGRVTISLGVATLYGRSDGCDAEELLRRADSALYQAKLAGRDTVRVYSPPNSGTVDEERCVKVLSAVSPGLMEKA